MKIKNFHFAFFTILMFGIQYPFAQTPAQKYAAVQSRLQKGWGT